LIAVIFALADELSEPSAAEAIDPPSSESAVVVYLSGDEVFADPVLWGFEKETGIKVQAVYDAEEAKSTALRSNFG
jgi:hypothetical protein